MTPRGGKLVALGAVALLLVAFVAWAAAVLERESVTVPVGLQGEARRNPLLAYERMLTGMGLPANSAPYLGALPPSEHLLVLRSSGRMLSPAAGRGLGDWVAAGGHLLLIVPQNELDLAADDDEDAPQRLELPLAEELGVRSVRATNGGARVALDLGSGALDVAFGGPGALEDANCAADLVVGEAANARVLSFAHGAGRATFVAGDGWVTRKALAQRDHAEAAWQLAQLGAPRAGALLVYGEKAPGFLATLVEHGWMVMASLAALLALYFVRAGARFGPVLPDPPRDQRDFSEHVAAAGEFLWRHGAHAALLEAPRRELRRKLQLTRPDLADLPSAALAAALAQLASLPLVRVERALGGATPPGDDAFTLVVRDLQQLRKSL